MDKNLPPKAPYWRGVRPTAGAAPTVARAPTVLAVRTGVLAAALRVWDRSRTEQTPEWRHVRDGLQTAHALGERIEPVLR